MLGEGASPSSKTPRAFARAVTGGQGCVIFFKMLTLNAGQKIVVYDGKKQELGEGTLIRQTVHADMNLIAYECEEHTILGRGSHFVRVGNEVHAIEIPD